MNYYVPVNENNLQELQELVQSHVQLPKGLKPDHLFTKDLTELSLEISEHGEYEFLWSENSYFCRDLPEFRPVSMKTFVALSSMLSPREEYQEAL